MKKALTLNNILGLLAIVLIFSISACKKDTSATNTSLTGKWANTIFLHTDIVGQYEFKSNDSVEYYSYQIDTVTRKILGYSYRMNGTYKVDNNTLTINSKAAFVNPANSFGPVTALVATASPATSAYTMVINKQNNREALSLYFDCPINASCVPSPLVYYRQ